MIGRKWLLLVVCGIFILSTGTGTALADGNINFLIGQKKLDSDDWDPVDEQLEFGLMMDFKGADWPVSLAIDFFVASDEEDMSGIDVKSETGEIHLGLRKYLPIADTLRAYVGGGIASVTAELTGSLNGMSASVDDSAIGFWAGGGLVYTASNVLNIGVDFRFSKAEVTFFDIEGEAGGTHLLAFVGFRF